ncbi:BolA/IbaG family iron-sulfur metabolism protein [Porticoccaceae bacterium]|jgi:acid stress-induced BolA-like protein IbaG/YrbA|nr:BolA/IbaG family iron-sulfur metabolism protein [Porticoccaceae bacterium]MDA9014898.1 BolA/IbaG family iron-sulfur metabolism protein [Porticoccaceae bacterium]MDA9569680.1 BolA/IbaG family iron-sulfur metabolism protein [Porticoccaceae bacterium]
MNADDVKLILKKQLTGCDIKVEVDGSHVNIVVIGDIFEGKRSVQRQQIVYAALQEHIASGVIHAVNMKTYSVQEWQQLT